MCVCVCVCGGGVYLFLSLHVWMVFLLFWSSVRAPKQLCTKGLGVLNKHINDPKIILEDFLTKIVYFVYLRNRVAYKEYLTPFS